MGSEVSFKQVTKKYGSNIAVDQVTFAVNPGETMALLGPNGAGKTTLVKMLLGFIRSGAGSITINGLPAGTPASRSRIGYLAERPQLPPKISGRNFLRRHASLAGIRPGSIEKEIDRVLELVAMKGRENKNASAFSHGMTQRVGLAAAVLGNPELLILDEPISGLDPLGIKSVRMILEQLKQQGVTIIINSHLLWEVEKVCGSAGIIHKGKLRVKGAMSEIIGAGETLEDVFMKHVEGTNG